MTYYINVYRNGFNGITAKSRKEAEEARISGCLYMLVVRMKS